MPKYVDTVPLPVIRCTNWGYGDWCVGCNWMERYAEGRWHPVVADSGYGSIVIALVKDRAQRRKGNQ